MDDEQAAWSGWCGKWTMAGCSGRRGRWHLSRVLGVCVAAPVSKMHATAKKASKLGTRESTARWAQQDPVSTQRDTTIYVRGTQNQGHTLVSTWGGYTRWSGGKALCTSWHRAQHVGQAHTTESGVGGGARGGGVGAAGKRAGAVA